MNNLISAIHFAAEAHQFQKRKNANKTPYINHPIEVMEILSSVGVTDTDVLAAAVLHDTIEDCGITADQISNKFGKRVADFVVECTDDKSLSKVIRKKLQIEHAKTISTEAKLIKYADKYSNIKSLIEDPPIEWSEDAINGYIDWSCAVCIHFKGINPIMDTCLTQIFAHQKLIDISQEDLNARLCKYYTAIDPTYNNF